MQEVLVRYISVSSDGTEGYRKFTIGAFKKHFPQIRIEDLSFEKRLYSKEESYGGFRIYFDLVLGNRNEYRVVTEETTRLHG